MAFTTDSGVKVVPIGCLKKVMSELQDILFENQSEKIKERVESYWTKRSDNFFTLKCEEAMSPHAEVWRQELLRLLPGFCNRRYGTADAKYLCEQ